jgi:hypothetical protein
LDGNGNNPQAPSTTLVLTITFDQLTGAVQVTGPIQNPLICMGMMEMAKQCVHNFVAEQAKGNRIVPASGILLIRN